MKNFSSALRTTIISLLLGVILVGLLFLYVNPYEVGKAFQALAWWKFGLLVVVSFAMFFMTSWRWKIILDSLKIPLPFKEVFLTRLAGFAVSYLTPVAEFGGAPARAYLIKKKNNLSFKISLTSAIIDNLLEIIVQVFLISLTVLYIIFYFSFPPRVNFIATAIGTLLLVLSGAFYLRIISGKGVVEKIFFLFKKVGLEHSQLLLRLEEKLKAGEEILIGFFTFQKQALYKGLFAGIVAYSLSALEIWVLALLMGFKLSILQVLIIKAIFSIAYIFPLPAALGVTEWSQAGFFGLIGAGGGLGVAFSLTFKAKNLVFVLIGIFYLAYQGLINIIDITQEKSLNN